MAERDIIFRAKFLQDEAVRAFKQYIQTLGAEIVAFNNKIEQNQQKTDQKLKEEVQAVKKAEQEKLDEFIARRLTIRRMAAEQLEEVKANANRAVAIEEQAEAEKTRLFLQRLEREQNAQKEATRLANKLANETDTARAAAQRGEKFGNIQGRGLDLTSQLGDQLPNLQNRIDIFRASGSEALRKGLIEQRAYTSGLQTLENRYATLSKQLGVYNLKIEENVAFTQQDVIALRKLEGEMADFGRTVDNVEQKVAESNIAIEKNSQQYSKMFKDAVIGGFALQQLGGFLRIYLTQPLIEAGKEIVNITLKFDELQTLLAERGGKDIDEIGKSMDTVGKVAKLRNFDLEASVTLYSRLFEATRGAISDKLFETIGKGISQVSSTLESSEKRAFLGQIQDVLGGGDVANLQKTLSLVPAIKSVFDEVKKNGEVIGKPLTDMDALIAAFQKFADLPALSDLSTKVKNISVDFELLSERIGRIYKEDLAELADFVSGRIIPLFTRWIDQLESASETTKALALAVAGLVVSFGTLISTIGLVLVAGFGLASLVRGLTASLAVLVGGMTEAEVATASFTTLLSSVTAEGTAIGGVLETIGTIIAEVVTPAVAFLSATIAAVVALLGVVIYQNLSDLQTSLLNLGKDILNLIWKALKAIYDVISGIIEALIALFKWLDQFTTVQEVLQFIAIILSFIINAIGVIISALAAVFDTISKIFQLFKDWEKYGIEEAAVRFKVAMLENLKSIIKYLPTFAQAWFNIDEQIRKAKEQTHKYADETDNATDKAKTLTQAFAQQTKQIETLTEAIKKQAQERIKAQNQEYNAYLTNNQNQQTAQIDATKSDLQTKLDKLDLSNEEQANLALQVQEQINQQESAKRRIEQQTAATRRIVEFKDEQIAKLRELEQQSRQQNKTYAQSFLNIMANTLQYGGDTQKDVKEALESNLKAANEFQNDFQYVYSKDREQIITFLGNQINAFNDEVKAIEEQSKNTFADIEKSNENIKKLKLKIEEKRKELGRIQETGTLEEQKAKLELQVKDNEAKLEIIKDLLKRDKIALSTAFDIFQSIETDEVRLAEEIAGIDLKIADVNAPYDTNKRKENKIKSDSAIKEKREEIKERFKKDKLDLVRDFINTAKDTNRQARELIEAFQQENDRFIDSLIGMAGLGAADKDRFDRAIADSKKMSAVVSGQLRDSYKSLNDLAPFTLLNNTFAPLGKTGSPTKFSGVADMVTNFVTKLKNTPFSALDEKGIDKFLEEGKKLLNFFSDEELGTGLDENERAQIQEFIARYLKFMEDLKAAREDMSDKNERALVKENEFLIAQKEHQRDLLDLEQQKIDLQKESLADNLDARAGNVRSLKDLSGVVYDALTGSRQKLFALEKESLENQRAVAQLEMEIALARLEVEQQIYLLKLQESKASQETIDRAKDAFEKQIILTRQRGQLEMDNLNLQIERLNQFSGSIGEVFTQAISGLFAAFTKGKEDTLDKAVTDAKDGAPPIVGHEAAHQTEKNVKTQLDWLNKLKGGLKTSKDFIFAFGDALMQLEKITIGTIVRAVKEELKALGQKMLIKSLEYAALALAALVFGDGATATKATAASIAYGVAAATAYAGAGILGMLDGNGEQKSANNSAAAATSTADNEAKIQTLKQQALSVIIRLDIYQDDSTVVKKQIKALNQNTELTNITVNQQQGWIIPQNP
jgi:hypothetical protein